jgi:hypothetical protein
MLETAPAGGPLATVLADGGALRYYPGFADLASARDLRAGVGSPRSWVSSCCASSGWTAG